MLAEQRMLVDQLIERERQFIDETLCIFCLGIKDFPSFIYPRGTSSNFMIHKQYFLDQINTATDIFVKLESYHYKVREKIINLATTIS